jgi:hypothetical protein
MYAAGKIIGKKIFCPQNSTRTILCPETEVEYIISYDYRHREGDAWQYRFFVLHNTPRLVELFGSPKLFAEDLDIFFNA